MHVRTTGVVGILRGPRSSPGQLWLVNVWGLESRRQAFPLSRSCGEASVHVREYLIRRHGRDLYPAAVTSLRFETDCWYLVVTGIEV